MVQNTRYQIDWFNVAFWVTVLSACLGVWALAIKGLFCLAVESL